MRLINLAFRVERFFIAGDRIDLPKLRALMDKGQFLTADGAGCVYVEKRENRCYLALLAVHPEQQGSGLGRRLIEAAENRAREWGCEAMDLKVVNLRVELPPFYRRLGYTENGTSEFMPDVPTTQPCHLINMAKPLI